MPAVPVPANPAALQHGAATGEVIDLEDMLEDMLRRDEGERLKVYTDTRGHPTIGVGRALDTQGISPAEAFFLLANDIKRVQEEAAGAFPWYGGLTDPRKAVLLSMIFQLGLPGTEEFKNFLSAVQYQNWSRAASEMRASVWHTQTPERVERLAVQMETGVYQQ